MTRSRHLKTGELAIGFEGDVLLTGGVGSCVVVCMWDPVKRIGAMAHTFSECRESGPIAESSAGSSPDSAVPHLVQIMVNFGTKRQNIQSRLVGAGNMFTGVEDGSAMDVGRRILGNALVALKHARLTLISQSVGGCFGRSVAFSIRTGLISVTLTNGDRVIL